MATRARQLRKLASREMQGGSDSSALCDQIRACIYRARGSALAQATPEATSKKHV